MDFLTSLISIPESAHSAYFLTFPILWGERLKRFVQIQEIESAIAPLPFPSCQTLINSVMAHPSHMAHGTLPHATADSRAVLP